MVRAVASGGIRAPLDCSWGVSDESKPQHMDTGTTVVGQGQEEIHSIQDGA